MSAGKFWLLTFLATVLAILIILEILCENQVSVLTYQVSVNETRVSQARQQNELLRQLVQQMAIESQRDPALVDVLAKRGIRVPHGPGANGAATGTPHAMTPPSPSSP